MEVHVRGIPVICRLLLGASVLLLLNGLLTSKAAAASGSMKLQEAITHAVETNPMLRASTLRMRALVSESEQAQLLPNPELELEAENFAGSGEFSGTAAAEYTIMVTQPVLLGGKRSRQKRVSRAGQSIAEWQHESARRDLIRNVTIAFVRVLENREHVKLSGELVRLSDALVEAAERRVKSGAASVLEQIKAEIEQATLLAQQHQATQSLASSRRQLATLLGISPGDLPLLGGDLYVLAAVPSLEDRKHRLRSNPDWQRLSAEADQLAANVSLADAQRVADLEIGIGWRRDEGAASDTYVFAAGMPIPIFNRGQGTRRAARHVLAAGQAERRAAELVLEGELALACSRVQQAHALVTSIKESILPAAGKAFDVSRDGYLQGRFRYLDLLDAQRTLFEAKGGYVESLSAYHEAVAELDGLTGGTQNGDERHNEE